MVLLFLASVLSFAISAVSGGGASLLLVPLLARTLEVASIPAALSVGTGTSSLARILTFREHIRWEVTVWFVPLALPMAGAGAFLLRFANPAYIQLLMALFLLANVRHLGRADAGPSGTPASRWRIASIGALAGFLSGLTGAVGVLFNRFYLNQGLTKQQIVATRATNEVLIHAIKLAVYLGVGLLDPQALTAGGIVAAAAILAALVLKPALKRLPYTVFARVGYAAMVVSGLTMLVGSATRVAREERIAFDYTPVVRGVDAKLQWRDSSLALEFEYEEGFEVEVRTSLEALTPAQRRLVDAQAPTGATVLVETVYAVGSKSFEAYYLQDGRVTRRIEFDLRGVLLDSGQG